MHKMTKVQNGSPVMKQDNVQAGVVVATGMLVLPKLRMDGTVKITAIDPFAILGTEDTTLKHNGKLYKGTKIYTKAGFFKVFAPVTTVLLAQAQAKMSAMPAVVAASVAIPSYIADTKLLGSGK